MPSFQLCRSTGHKPQNWYLMAAYTSETNGVWPCTAVRMWLICSNRKLYDKKRYFCYCDTTQQYFFSYTLWTSSLHKSSIHICIEERYVYTSGSQPFLNQAPPLSSKRSQAPPELLHVKSFVVAPSLYCLQRDMNYRCTKFSQIHFDTQ